MARAGRRNNSCPSKRSQEDGDSDPAPAATRCDEGVDCVDTPGAASPFSLRSLAYLGAGLLLGAASVAVGVGRQPKCGPCPIVTTEAPPLVEHDVNGMTCKIELAQLQTQIYDLQDELPKARALWAAERDGLVRQCIRPSEGLPDASTEFVEPDVAGVSCKDKLSQLQAEMDDLAGELPKARKEWEVERERLLHQCSRPSEVPPESSTSATMVLQAPDASSIVEPKTSSEPCVVELAQLRTQFEDLVEELPKARREWAAERGRLRAECVAERESALQQCSRPYEATNAEAMEIEEAVPVVETTSPSGHPILQVNGEGVSPSGGSTGWPNCVERGIVLRGHNMYSIFVDVTAQLGDAASGCYMGNCASSDKFVASKSEDCARMCGVFPSCKFWTFGEQDGQRLCFLRGGDGGREAGGG